MPHFFLNTISYTFVQFSKKKKISPRQSPIEIHKQNGGNIYDAEKIFSFFTKKNKK